jgi:N-acetylmuramoyl-L-alanine amidase
VEIVLSRASMVPKLNLPPSLLRCATVARFQAWVAVALLCSALIASLARAQLSAEEKRKREEFLKARSEQASPTPAESPHSRSKSSRHKKQKNASAKGEETGAQSSSKEAKTSHRSSKTKKKSVSHSTKPETAEKKTSSSKEKKSSSTAARSKSKKEKSSTSKRTVRKKSTHQHKEATAAKREEMPAAPGASSAKSIAAPAPAPAVAPRAVAVPQSSGHGERPVVVATPQLTIQKSGYEEEQGLVPTPPPPRRRFLFWPFSRSRSTEYRYLTRSVIEEIRRAPVMRNRWKFIVVHNSGTRQGNARVFDYYHRHVRRMRNGLAYHFVIGNGTSTGNGQIEVGDRWRRQLNGGHVHSDFLNSISLGICLVGDFNRDQPTRAQLESCEELIRYLRERCGKADGKPIPVRPHREMNPPRWPTDCPGDRFPYSWFRRF